MPLITRNAKGSKLNAQEMDNNLLYLEQLAISGSSSTSNMNIIAGTGLSGGGSSSNVTLYIGQNSITENQLSIIGGPTAGYILSNNGTNLQWIQNLSTDNFISVTYSRLVELMGNNGLITGSYYKITDFRTCYDQPDYDYNGNTIISNNYKTCDNEPIIVIALSENKIESNAFQEKYPNDIIKYDITWNNTEITGSTAYGRITERIDEFGNRTDYDHRNILFKRYRSYFHDYAISGRIDVNNFTVTGTNSLFTSELSINNIILIEGIPFKVESIIDDTNMTIIGHNGIYVSNSLCYKGYIELDEQFSNIPYTHTQMKDMDNIEAPTASFLMDGVVQSGKGYFGDDSQYFTNLYPGLFTMVAYNININYFSIEGGLGADGSGNLDFYDYTTTFDNTDYTVYVKKVFNAIDPSVNHIIIFNGLGGSHSVHSSTNDDYDRIVEINSSSPSTISQVHFLLTSKPNGEELTTNEVQDIVNAYLPLIATSSISTTLTNLNNNYTDIISIPSSIYRFNDIGVRGNINDGGNDMYDGGNVIYTDLSQRYKAYEPKQNNIIDDTYSHEEKTFKTDDELLQDNYVSSRNNYLGDNSNYYNTDAQDSDFMLSNIIFGMYCYNNIIGDLSHDNTFRYFYGNKIGMIAKNNIFYGESYHNIFESYLNNNRIYNDFYDNQIGSYFEYNFIIGVFRYNIIDSEFTYNKIFNQFFDNEIKINFSNNHIFNIFENNRVFSNFSYNNIYNQYYNNDIGYNFSNNNIYNQFYNNSFKDDSNNNTIYYSFYHNHIDSGFQYNTIGSLPSIDNYYVNDNIIGNRFKSNTIHQNLTNNHIGVDFYSNILSDNFSYNKSDNFVIFNNFNYTLNNSLSTNFMSNTFNGTLGYNNFTTQFNSNITNNFQYNNVITEVSSIDFTTSTHIASSYNKTILKASNDSLYLNYFDGTASNYVSITD